MNYKNCKTLKATYEKYGSTRKAAKFLNCSNATIIRWMRKFKIPRIPKLYLIFNNSGKGRLAELYICGFPYFRKDIEDMGVLDDRYKVDLKWKSDLVDVKSCHNQKRPIFRIKLEGKRHKANKYICLYFDDNIDPLIPMKIWIIPSSECPHSGVGISFSEGSKYDRFEISNIKGINFNKKTIENYNNWFRKKYSKYLPNKEKGEK